MILTRVVPVARDAAPMDGGGIRIDLDAPDAGAALTRLYTPPPGSWLRVNSVVSVGGSVTGPDGSSETLTTPADRLLLRVIRSLADVVLAGAASIRREGLHLPADARLAIVTGSGDLGALVVPDDIEPGRVIVLCPPSAVSRIRRQHAALHAEVVVVDPGAPGSSAPGRVDPREVVAALHARGLARIVCEGGPTLVGGLVEAGLVDELCLTTSPVLTATSAPLIPGDAAGRWPLTLTQLLVDESGMLFARWAMAPARD